MNISNKKILDSFFYCLKFYDNTQKSGHWEKYDSRRGLYTIKNLKNFRNNFLSQGLDDEYSKSEINKLFNKLTKYEKQFLFKNKNKRNIGNKINYIIKSKTKFYGTEFFPIKWFLEIKKYLNLEENNILEIGAGFGEFAQIIIKNIKCKYLIFDLPEANVLSTYYLNKNLKNKKIYIIKKNSNFFLKKSTFDKYDIFILPPWCKLDKKIKFDIIINTRSMMEMSYNTISNYFSLIQKHIRNYGIFLNINRYLKKTKKDKIKISKFPYDKNWEVIVSKKSWAQNWIHMLIAKRIIKNGNIKKHLYLLKFYSLKYEIIQFFHELKRKYKNIFKTNY